MQWSKNQLMSQLTEAQVPPLSPELSEGRRTERLRHDGLGFDAKALPKEGGDLKSAEVKEQDQTYHPDPSP